jgi:glycine/D-amino acid oxidase-like deaminating enzyme
MRGAAENYFLACREMGRDRAGLVWKWTEENLEGLRSEGIERLDSYRRVPSCLLAMDEEELDQLRRSESMLREDGFEAAWIDRGDDAAWATGKPLGGLLNPRDAGCSPWDVMRHLASRLEAPVHEHQEVLSIDDSGADAVSVRITDGEIRAGRVILCTNAYAGLLAPSLAGIVLPRRGQMLALRAPGIRLDCSYYANHGYDYFRQAADGTIAVGGRRNQFLEQEVGYEDATPENIQAALVDLALRVLGLAPGRFEIVARWSGAMGFSPDGLPLVGPVVRDWRSGRVWFCGGFTGHGMSMAYRTAACAIGAMLHGAENPFPLARAVV